MVWDHEVEGSSPFAPTWISYGRGSPTVGSRGIVRLGDWLCYGSRFGRMVRLGALGGCDVGSHGRRRWYAAGSGCRWVLAGSPA